MQRVRIYNEDKNHRQEKNYYKCRTPLRTNNFSGYALHSNK
jgi:hypothetical protein